MKLKIVLFLLTLLLWGCSDFLEESSQDEVRPSTVADMIELMNGEALPATYEGWNNMTLIFTDDLECIGDNKNHSNKSGLEQNRLKFGWQPEMFDAVSGNDEINFWEYPYKKILGCNVVLGYTNKVTGGQEEKDNLLGEAYAMRGYYYLMLVNFFGEPYNVGDPEKNLGVPLKLTMDVTEDFFPRNTVAEVYRSIEKDLLEANRLLEANPLDRGTYHMDHLSAKALLSRMYLYMENWDKCIEYAEKVLDVKPKLLSLKDFESMFCSKTEGVYNGSTPDEILWRYVGDNYGTGNHFKWPSALVPSQSLLGSYDSEYFWDEVTDEEGFKGDLRRGLYFDYAYDQTTWEYVWHEFVKDQALLSSGLRNAELYVNLAEAYTRKFMASGNDEFRTIALHYLNFLREHRYDDSFKEVNIQDANELYEFCKAERRREMAGEENHRWFDMRRWDRSETIKHVWFVEPGEVQEFTLEPNSPRYVLRIPSRVMEYNRELLQNP